MNDFTDEQLMAIKKKDSNIIVSAGAGSGKTRVLTERVINKLKNDTKINELLILTFTNAAAGEMKERISKRIMANDKLKDNLDYLESSYITTFDAYSLSLVKKYHYLLNIGHDINIIEENTLSLVKKEILDNIFDYYYENNDNDFNVLINDLCIKNDTEIKENILDIIKKIDLIIDKEKFLNNYISNYLSDDKIKEYINDYNNLIYDEIDNIVDNISFIENILPDYADKIKNQLKNFICCKNYNDLKNNYVSSIGRKPNNSDEIKEFKDNIDNSLRLIKTYLRFENEKEIYYSFDKLKIYINIIIKIILKFNKSLDEYKYQNNAYEFNDIELMVLDLFKKHPNVLEEVRSSFKEIMVDEYQDTSDIQEQFLKYMDNGKNIYMVGDIKQSIYKFRNANVNNFKDKYDNYTKLNGGIKIDLLKNFRSREEVINGINDIFSLVMDNYIGGVDYKNTQQMVAGNTTFDDNKNNKQDYNLEILNYDNSLYTNFNEDEIEAFIIGNDILNKINNKYQVFDNELRNATYSDFCIIIDRYAAFNTYKKIFTHLHIPLNIYNKNILTNEILTSLIYNILSLIIKINNKEYDQEFRYYMTSILRSYLYEFSDNEILKIFNDNSFNNTDLFNKCNLLCEYIDIKNIYEILNDIINEFNFYEKLILVDNINDNMVILENILDIANNLNNIGYSIEDFIKYLKDSIESNAKIEYESDDNGVGVRLINIHKSKGLEFNICYYSGYYKKFNDQDIKKRFIFNDKYGFIIPYNNTGLIDTILKDLYKKDYYVDMISEEIRLLYVALTRAKEKMIIVANINNDKQFIGDYKIKYRSFNDIISSIKNKLSKYIKNVDLGKIDISKNYMYSSTNKLKDSKDNRIINIDEISILDNISSNEKASKKIKGIISKEDKEKLLYGTKIHEQFEYGDFLNSDNEYIINLKNKLNITSNSIIYKEHEFYYSKDDINYHGIIDLIIEEDNIIKIVDYKLKNINDDNYHKQLKVYYDYLKGITNKNVECYLYSILDNILEKIDID